MALFGPNKGPPVSGGVVATSGEQARAARLAPSTDSPGPKRSCAHVTYSGSLATIGESKLQVQQLPRHQFGARGDTVVSRDDGTSHFHI